MERERLGELSLTLCDLEEFERLGYVAEECYEGLEGVLVSRARLIEDEDHRQIINTLCMSTSRVWIGGRWMESHSTASVIMRSREKVKLLVEENMMRRGGGRSLSSSERSVARGRRGNGKRNSVSSEERWGNQNVFILPDVVFAYAKKAGNSGSSRGKGEDGGVRFSCEHPTLDVSVSSLQPIGEEGTEGMVASGVD